VRASSSTDEGAASRYDTRYEKRAAHFLAVRHLAATLLGLRDS
jgi:hypothetical protein